MKTSHVLAVVAGVAVIALAGCGSGGSTSARGLTPPSPPSLAASMPSASPAASPASSPTASPTHVKPVPSPTPSPESMEDAAADLYQAWMYGFRDDALDVASASAVKKLFARDWQPNTYFWGGCTYVACYYNFVNGTIEMTFSGSKTKGYKVKAVRFGSAG